MVQKTQWVVGIRFFNPSLVAVERLAAWRRRPPRLAAEKPLPLGIHRWCFDSMEGRQCFFWLVVWLPFFLFPYVGLLIIPIDGPYFSEGFKPPASFRCFQWFCLKACWVKPKKIPQITILLLAFPVMGGLWHCFTHIIWETWGFDSRTQGTTPELRQLALKSTTFYHWIITQIFQAQP